MRNKVIEDAKILKLIDFNKSKIFKNAGIYTMIMILQKNKNNEGYKFEYIRFLSENTNLNNIHKDVENEKNIEIFYPEIIKHKHINKILTFNKYEDLLEKIQDQANFNLNKNEVTIGIIIPQDFVKKKHIPFLDENINVGDGIFVLNEKELVSLNLSKDEMSLIKPFYTPKEIEKYYTINKNKYWIIFTQSKFKNTKLMENYPNIKKHLDKFSSIITSDFKPYGLHRAGNIKSYTNEKILSLRRCTEPIFTYIDFECFVSNVYIIIQTDRVSLKYLVGILNSNLIKFWLKNKGKMKGNIFQIDKEPLLNLPLKIGETDTIGKIEKLVNEVILIKSKNGCNIDIIEKQINEIVYQMYNLKDDEVKILESGD